MVGQIQKLPREVWPVIQSHWCDPKCFEGMARYLEALPESAAVVDKIAAGKDGALRDIPLVVLSCDSANPAERADHEKLAGLSSRGRMEIAKRERALDTTGSPGSGDSDHQRDGGAMQILIPVVFLSLIAALLIPSLQSALRNALAARPSLLFLAALILSALFCGVAAALGALSTPLAALILIYTLLPSVCAFFIRRADPPVALDFGIILLLWLPLEFSLGRWFVPRPEQGLLHIAAYGVSVTLGLTLSFSCSAGSKE